MELQERLWEQERRFWLDDDEVMTAHMADGAVMIMPYPAGILRGPTIGEKKRRSPDWADVTFSDRSCHANEGTAVIAYRADASGPQDSRYAALCASTYIRDGDAWRLISHQQTPVDP